MKKEKTNDKKSVFKTLLLSVLLSSPGPLVLGLGLTVGRSSTQISDFTRRSAELLAIIASFVVFCVTSKNESMGEKKKKRIENASNAFVGIIMCISGLSMIILTLTSETENKGNVVPAMVIALSGVIVNSMFWRKYGKLYHEFGNVITEAQSRLYGAKSIVDLSITLTLLVVALFPGKKISYYFDMVGSVFVSLYMIRSGIKTVVGSYRRSKTLASS